MTSDRARLSLSKPAGSAHDDLELSEGRKTCLALLEEGLQAVEPRTCVPRALGRLRDRGVRLDDATVFAFGKAALGMARAALETLDRWGLNVKGGVIVGPEATRLDPLIVRVGGHPFPASDALETGRLVMSMASRLTRNDTALCLISGGGSSMLELPNKGISIDEIIELSRALMARGANIAELNTVRTRLSRIKGGGLAKALAPARIVNLVLSDVPGHGPELVASGPTILAQPEHDAFTVVERYGLTDRLCAATRDALSHDDSHHGAEEAPCEMQTEVAADNRTARSAMVEAALRRGIELVDRDGFFAGEARDLGATIAHEAGERAFVWGGETTVTVRGDGKGGRNQELVLAAFAAGWTGGTLASLGTDGIDGSSLAAGALLDRELVHHVQALELDANDALARNDSATFFERSGAALISGRTGTNVADIVLYLPER